MFNRLEKAVETWKEWTASHLPRPPQTPRATDCPQRRQTEKGDFICLVSLCEPCRSFCLPREPLLGPVHWQSTWAVATVELAPMST